MQRYVSNEPSSARRAATGRATRADRQLLDPTWQFVQLPDVGEWVLPATLKGWIEQEVESLNWGNPLLEDYLRQHPEYRPKVMLSLLAYAYARRVFSSAEIVCACQTDPVFRTLCKGKTPFVAEVWNFRRKNRAVLKKILAGIFRRAILANPNAAAARFVPELELDACAEQRLDIARHMDAMD